MIIGIAGGSSSGKSTLCKALIARLGPHKVALLAQDHYYRRQPLLEQNNIELLSQKNYDHPDALEFSLLIQHLKQLQNLMPIQMPQYDFRAHDRKQQFQTIEPLPFIVVEGILILSQPGIRQLLDLAIFVEASQDIRLRRRASRDQAERGRSYESVVKQFETTVNPMHDRFVEPSKHNADLVISGEIPVAKSLAQVMRHALFQTESVP